MTSNPYTYKTLDEMNKLLKSDPEFYRFYFMRINHYARNSKNGDIRKCEILHMENKFREDVISEARVAYNRLKQLRVSPLEECEILIGDLEKVFELDEIFEKFSSKLDKVEQTDEGLLSVEPTNSIEYYARSRRFGTLSSMTNRSNDLLKVLESCPNHYEALNNLGVHSDTVIKIAPNFAKGYFNRAFVSFDYNEAGSLREIRDYDMAIALLDFMSSAPHTLQQLAHHFRGVTHKLIGNLDKAIQDFSFNIAKDVISYFISTSTSLFYRGMCYSEKEKFEEAIVDFSRAIQNGHIFARSERNSAVQKLKEKIMKL